MSEDCFICNKHQGSIDTAGIKIYENDFVYVGHIDRGGGPSYLGHIMIDLKRHAASLGDMTPDEAGAFGQIMARVSKAVKETQGAEHIYALVSGNSVPHLHMHIVPRYPKTPAEYWGPNEVYDWPNAPFGMNEEIVKVCEQVKRFLEEDSYVSS
ncbi:HIT family hydrolase [Fictibacillus phosphorivorans]|uniref:HIT family hydrolase n=1 Tax=Fictibacillus phosphorivorans TaxID=1221500 RepID=A0A163SJU6_9BACL|nr:HIT family protein [Fictibacillus phosphorivorans]KZE69267.1 HIT family hydrolase [Fictibacillus phosphorivorans]